MVTEAIQQADKEEPTAQKLLGESVLDDSHSLYFSESGMSRVTVCLGSSAGWQMERTPIRREGESVIVDPANMDTEEPYIFMFLDVPTLVFKDRVGSVRFYTLG